MFCGEGVIFLRGKCGKSEILRKEGIHHKFMEIRMGKKEVVNQIQRINEFKMWVNECVVKEEI